jgi:hypothetical protein
MADHNIDRAELERVLGLRIPESSTIEITITSKPGKKERLKAHRGDALRPDISAAKGISAAKLDASVQRVEAAVAPQFQGRLVFEEGLLTEMKALDKTIADFYKNGPVGPCW